MLGFALGVPGLASARSRAARHAAATCTATTAVTFGAAPTAGSIGAPGVTQCFTFGAAAGDVVRVRVARTSGTLVRSTTIVRPDSSTACGPSGALQIDCSINVTGTWTVTVRDSGGTNTGSFSIAVQRLNNPSSCGTVGIGAVLTTASIAAATEMDCYRFTGAVGDVMRIRVAATSGTLHPHIELIRPN